MGNVQIIPGRAKYTHYDLEIMKAGTHRKVFLMKEIRYNVPVRIEWVRGRRFTMVDMERDGLSAKRYKLKEIGSSYTTWVKWDQVKVAVPPLPSEFTCDNCGLTWPSFAEAGFRLYSYMEDWCVGCKIPYFINRNDCVKPEVGDTPWLRGADLWRASVSGGENGILPPASGAEVGFIEHLAVRPDDRDTWLIYSDWLIENQPYKTAEFAASVIRRIVAEADEV